LRPFGLIDKIFKKACGRHIVMLVAELVAIAHRRHDCLVIGHQLAEHVAWRHILFVVVLNALQFGNLPDRPKCRSADLANPLSDVVGAGENLRRLFIQEQMVVAEMRPADAVAGRPASALARFA